MNLTSDLPEIADSRLRSRPQQSIRFRLAALGLMLFGGALVVFAVLTYYVVTSNHLRDFDADLFNHAVDVSQGIDFGIFGDFSVDPQILAGAGKIFPFQTGQAFFQILGDNGRLLARSRSLGEARVPYTAYDQDEIRKVGVAFRTISGREIEPYSKDRAKTYRLISYAVTRGSPVGAQMRFVLQIAAPRTILDDEARALLLFLAMTVPLSLLGATVGSLFLTGQALRPLSDIIRRARKISAARLSQRIPVPPTDDELRQLALTLNDLLTRLQQAFESQERFVADASHQLKTPLAILRGELDLLRSRPRSPEEIAVALDTLSQELDSISRLVEELLLLARVDAGTQALALQEVRLDELVLDVTSRIEVLARAKNVRIRCNLEGADFETQGDPDLLRSMIQNIVDNAVRFSPAGEAVDLKLSTTDDRIELRVTDRGPGIPLEKRERLFERFYRVNGDASEPTSRGKGSGLGLAIARRIAEAHQGQLDLETTAGPGGATFRVSLNAGGPAREIKKS